MSTNDGGHITELYVGSVDDEMAALEQLGPLTRCAIYDSPIRFSAVPILQQLREFEAEALKRIPQNKRHLYCINFAEPQFDRSIADGVLEEARKFILKDRSEYDANIGIKPLIARVSVKSLREQRRSARRIRW
jgi:hypothetical protein